MADDTLVIQVFDDKKALVTGTCFMSYALLNVLVRIVGDINQVGMVDLNPDIADEVLDEVLAPRTGTGKRNTPEGWTPPDLPLGEAEKIFSWVKEHIVDFFIRRLQNTQGQLERTGNS